MNDYLKLSDEMKRAIMLHFKRHVPIDLLAIRKDQRDMLTRVEYLVQAYQQDPKIDVYRTLYELSKSRLEEDYTHDRLSLAVHRARREEEIFKYAIGRDVLDIEVG